MACPSPVTFSAANGVAGLARLEADAVAVLCASALDVLEALAARAPVGGLAWFGVGVESWHPQSPPAAATHATHRTRAKVLIVPAPASITDRAPAP
jgi:hypothetical protein